MIFFLNLLYAQLTKMVAEDTKHGEQFISFEISL